MPILGFRVATYSRNVYLFGNVKLCDIPTTPDNYKLAIMQYPSTHQDIINKKQVDTAFANGWITQNEYDQTMSYM